MMVRRKMLMLFLPSVTLGVLLGGCGNSQKPTASTSSFDFGQVVVPESSTRDVVTITNNGTSTASVSAKMSGDSSFKLAPGLSCGTSLVAGGSCSMAVSFAPSTSGSDHGTLSLTVSGTSSSQQNISLKGSGVQLSGGQSLVTATANPVVALYSYQPNVQGMVHVEFGMATSYGTITSSVATPSNGDPVQIFVAGMKQNTAYHMRAVVTESDGTIVDDTDHTFTTSSFPADMLPTLTATTAPGQTPQPGIELADATNSTSNSNYLGAYATDLQGNIIWGYNFPDRPSKYTIIQPIKLLPNGNLIVVLSYPSQFILPGQGVTLTPADESVDLIREIDLAGDPVAQLTLDSLNAKLASAGYSNISLVGLHHDVTILPNGHMIVIASMLKPYNNLTGYSGTTNVLGDVLVDLDENFNVSWVWSEFDHLDVNRHPIAFPDWTHTNAVIYSPSDGDLLVSIRHQSWIVKVDYQNGKGSGDVLWRLGNGGDFALVGGTAPEDWFYGQHAPSFAGPATSGQFSLTMMDNGYGRLTSSGSQCTSSGSACYTTVPVVAVDEVAKTATITYRQMVPTSQFNIWGGNAEVLASGDLEYDLCAEGNASEVDEVRMTSPAQVVWTLKESGANLYRAMRIPSLYPGVQW